MRISMALAATLWIFPALAGAEDWERLEGQDIATALVARVLGYPDGTLQDFFADGRTLSGDRFGRWEVREDRYCSQWPPSDRWDCFLVEQSGLDLRFTDDNGTTIVGRYVDLQ